MSRCGVAPKLTTSSYAILGLLAVRPWTTYELAKQVQRSLNWFWPRAERKLYDEPKRLVESGLATASRELTGQRPRTVYTITRAGRAELRRWLGDPPAPRTVEFEAMVKVFFASAGSLGQLRTTLGRIEGEARARAADLAAMAGQPARFPERVHLNALAMQLQFEQERAILRWSQWAQEQTEAWRSATDAGPWEPHRVLDEIAGAGSA